jgi:mono/diheme cytochrome c family protein
MKKSVVYYGLAILVGAAFWGLFQITGNSRTAVAAETDITVGKELYEEYCAACHGADLEGQPDWRTSGEDGRLPAPPHDETGHTWHHPDQLLFDYTKLGGKAAMALQGMEFNSGMPGFGAELSDEEIWNILAYIKSSWSERMRELQAERTRFDNERRSN